MTKRAKRIRKANVTHLSLCREGKTGFRGLFKSADAETEEIPFLAKSDDEQGLLTIVAYPPNLLDEDSEWAAPEEIQGFAHDWMKNGARLDLEHDFDDLPADAAYPVESFIIQAGDSRFDGMEANGKTYNSEELAGGWGTVIKLEDEGLRKAYREGAWTGASIGSKDPYFVQEQTPEERAELSKAVTQDMAAKLSRMFRRALRDESVDDVHLSVRVPKPNDFDAADGPRFSINLSGSLE